MFYKGKDENIPEDVYEIFFSGNFWYAASEARLTNGKPVAVGSGNTEEEAITEMRDLVSRYVPVAERQRSWDPKEKYAAPTNLGKFSNPYRNPVLLLNRRVKLDDGREAIIMDKATHRKSRTMQIDGETALQVIKSKSITSFWDQTVGWIECVWD